MEMFAISNIVQTIMMEIINWISYAQEVVQFHI